MVEVSGIGVEDGGDKVGTAGFGGASADGSGTAEGGGAGIVNSAASAGCGESGTDISWSGIGDRGGSGDSSDIHI